VRLDVFPEPTLPFESADTLKPSAAPNIVGLVHLVVIAAVRIETLARNGLPRRQYFVAIVEQL
jgi:hypothetical protein